MKSLQKVLSVLVCALIGMDESFRKTLTVKWTTLSMLVLLGLSGTADSTGHPTMASVFKFAEVSGVGKVVSGAEFGRGARAIFVYKVQYGTGLSRTISICTAEQLQVGIPVLFAIGGSSSNAACPKGSHYVPLDRMSMFVLPGVEGYDGKRLMFRSRFPHNQSIGCGVERLTVSYEVWRDGVVVQQEIGPMYSSGDYFSLDAFLDCVRRVRATGDRQ